MTQRQVRAESADRQVTLGQVHAQTRRAVLAQTTVRGRKADLVVPCPVQQGFQPNREPSGQVPPEPLARLAGPGPECCLVRSVAFRNSETFRNIADVAGQRTPTPRLTTAPSRSGFSFQLRLCQEPLKSSNVLRPRLCRHSKRSPSSSQNTLVPCQWQLATASRVASVPGAISRYGPALAPGSVHGTRWNFADCLWPC